MQWEMRKETESKYVIRDDLNEEEEYPSFDSYPQFFEPIETESRNIVRDDVNEEEAYPSFDSYPRFFEPIYPDFFWKTDQGSMKTRLILMKASIYFWIVS